MVDMAKKERDQMQGMGYGPVGGSSSSQSQGLTESALYGSGTGARQEAAATAVGASAENGKNFGNLGSAKAFALREGQHQRMNSTGSGGWAEIR